MRLPPHVSALRFGAHFVSAALCLFAANALSHLHALVLAQ